MAICLTAWGIGVKRFSDPEIGARPYSVPVFLALIVFAVSPFWIPIAFVAYAVGRKKFGVGFAIAFAVTEAISVGAMYLAVAAVAK